MNSEATHKLSISLSYLRERARLAHLDGNGVLVNHLASVALDSIAQEKTPKPPVDQWAWAVIFGLYWLTDSYMLHEIDKIFDHRAVLSEDEAPRKKILKIYYWLIRQPLDNRCIEQKDSLRRIALDWIQENPAVEDEVMLIHVVELLWYRDSIGGEWKEIGAAFSRRVSSDLSSRILATVRRLEIQTSFAAIGVDRTNDLRISPDWDAPQWLPQLWQCIFDSDFAAVDRILAEESPRYSAATPLARILFDARHRNRFHGNFGDPQSTGLTRRRVITSLSPELGFHEIRTERTQNTLLELYAENGGASDRFFGFTLAMLLELASLRRWDLGAWSSAVDFNARFCAEAFSKDEGRLYLAAMAVLQSLTSLHFSEKNEWLGLALSKLEYIPRPELISLVRNCMGTRRVRYHQVRHVLERLGDAVPEDLYQELAEWTVRYVEYSTRVNPWGSNTDRIGFLLPILAVLPECHGAWNTLWPIIESLIENNPHIWHGDCRKILRYSFTNGPLTLVEAAARRMLGYKIDSGDAREIWELVCEVAGRRPQLGSILAKEIIAAAPTPADLLCLRDADWAKPHIVLELQDIHAKALGHLGNVVKGSVMVEDQKQFAMGVGGWNVMLYVSWTRDDIPSAQSLIDAICHTRVLRSHLVRLVEYLSMMVGNGPDEIAELVAPRLLGWLKTPPKGIDPFEDDGVVFSTVTFRSHESSEVVSSLAELAVQVRNKVPYNLDGELVAYLTRVSAQPPQGVTQHAIRLALELAVDNPSHRSELLSVCQALLLAAQLRALADPTKYEELVGGFRFPTWFLSPSREPLVPEGLVHEFARKIEPLVIACAGSGTARVRGQIAAFLATLRKRKSLTPELETVCASLASDPRASVRRLIS